MAPTLLDFGQELRFLRKKNAPYLYDIVITHALDWPSLTCQWFPDKELYAPVYPPFPIGFHGPS